MPQTNLPSWLKVTQSCCPPPLPCPGKPEGSSRQPAPTTHRGRRSVASSVAGSRTAHGTGWSKASLLSSFFGFQLVRSVGFSIFQMVFEAHTSGLPLFLCFGVELVWLVCLAALPSWKVLSKQLVGCLVSMLRPGVTRRCSCKPKIKVWAGPHEMQISCDDIPSLGSFFQISRISAEACGASEIHW